MNRCRLTLLTAICVAVAICCPLSLAFAAEETPTAAPAENAPPTTVVSDSYRIVEEDILRMDVWGEKDLSAMQMQVTPDGNVNVAYIGELQAAGLTLADLTREIAKKFEEAQILINPKIQLTLLSMHQPTVRVLGEVQRPGSITFKDGDTILDAIAQAGSYTENAMLEKATLTHKDSSRQIPLDLKKMFAGDLTQNYALQKGDNIYIPPEDYQNKFYVLGHVMRPGLYSLKDRTTVLSAISLAGGQTERGSLRSTVVVRGDPAKPERVACDLTRLFDKGDLTQDIQLQAGDVVMVPETKKPNINVISSFISTILNLTYLRRYGF